MVVARGSQFPRVSAVPDYVSSSGQEAVELAAECGLQLDPWQAMVLEDSLGERADGTWSAFEVGLVLARQNGKDAILEARELAGLFILREQLLIHSAHLFATSREHFVRLLSRIEANDDLVKRVKRVSRSHGEEGIELRREYGGCRIRFFTRTSGSARGFSCDCLLLNEAMFLQEAAIGAMLPTLSARQNPQVWYAGSPVDQFVHEHGVVLARVRERGLEGNDPRLAYFEWGCDAATPDDVDDPSDRELWAQANPGLGIRISEEHVESERRSMNPRTFAVERLGVGDWPPTTVDETGPIELALWEQAVVEKGSMISSDVVIAFDTNPDRSMTAIAIAGYLPDGKTQVEIDKHEHGTGWVIDALAGYVERLQPARVVCAARSPAAALLQKCEEAGIAVEALTDAEHAHACGHLIDLVDQDELRHLGSEELASAVRGAVTRPMGDSWAWSRKNSSVDISPLVAATLATWGVSAWVTDGEMAIF